MPKASRATAAVDMGVSPEDTEEITTKLGEYLVCFDFMPRTAMRAWDRSRRPSPAATSAGARTGETC